ncbi:MAG: hypothetical protein FWE38_00450 [Firmicutes bacterium]|nr:hypothetical protein [Bacillota bacterium]
MDGIKDGVRNSIRFEISEQIAQDVAATVEYMRELGTADAVLMGDRILGLEELCQDVVVPGFTIEQAMQNAQASSAGTSRKKSGADALPPQASMSRGRFFVVPQVVE